MIFSKTFERLKEGLGKTRDKLVSGIQKIVIAKGKIDDDTLNQLEELLISGDIGVQTSLKIVNNIKKRVREEKYETTDQLVALLKDEITRLLATKSGKPSFDVKHLPGKPYTIMVVGVNGVGKTTTIGKLANNFQSDGLKVLVGAADTFRAAANQQLEIWAQRAGVEIVQQKHGADPAAVAFDALSSAIARNIDVVIIDTAGRLHTRVNLMDELKKIRRALEKKLPGAPHEVLLILDANTGQNALQQARQFSESVGVTGLVITKLDGTAKGGIIFSIMDELHIPVKYIGVGEKIDDLQPFDAGAYVDALFEDFVPAP
jgi:fused signal recognition particle receptor